MLSISQSPPRCHRHDHRINTFQTIQGSESFHLSRGHQGSRRITSRKIVNPFSVACPQTICSPTTRPHHPRLSLARTACPSIHSSHTFLHVWLHPLSFFPTQPTIISNTDPLIHHAEQPILITHTLPQLQTFTSASLLFHRTRSLPQVTAFAPLSSPSNPHCLRRRDLAYKSVTQPVATKKAISASISHRVALPHLLSS